MFRFDLGSSRGPSRGTRSTDGGLLQLATYCKYAVRTIILGTIRRCRMEPREQ